ncbi:MAG: TonB-dependent receptor plug domain-containing protein, partial [Verrucomicrobiota bacterium]
MLFPTVSPHVSALRWLCAALALSVSFAPAFGQVAGTNSKPSDESPVELSPFVVSSESELGYLAKETLAGMRIKTDLKDVGAAIDVLTEAFLNDVGVTNMFDALQYVPNMEYNSYPSDNDANNNSQWFSASYKSRGIVGSTVLVDFFSTSSIPIDRYNTENLTLLRGANAILFGIGSPSGIVGSSTKRAQLSRHGYTFRFVTDDYGTLRGELDVNRYLLKNKLGVRLNVVAQDKKLYQTPSLNRRNAATLSATYKPFTRTAITVMGETGIYERLHV